MTKLILLALLVSTSIYAQETETTEKASVAGPALDTPALITENMNRRVNFNPRESHWITTLGFEAMKYPVPYDFDGARSNFSAKDQEIFGGRLGVGGEIYLGAGIVTTTRVEGYYMGTLFAETLNGGPDSEDVDFAYTKKTSQIFGFDVSQQLGFMFEMKTRNPIMRDWSYLTVEPYIEAGFGTARAYNRINYSYDTGSTPTSAREGYKDTINDDLTNARVGGGINFTSSEGYFLYLRATVNKYDVVKRHRDTYSQPNGQVATISKNNEEPDLDPITVYALGGGYKF
jgi:hypothetical protein